MDLVYVILLPLRVSTGAWTLKSSYFMMKKKMEIRSEEETRVSNVSTDTKLLLDPGHFCASGSEFLTLRW